MARFDGGQRQHASMLQRSGEKNQAPFAVGQNQCTFTLLGRCTDGASSKTVFRSCDFATFIRSLRAPRGHDHGTCVSFVRLFGGCANPNFDDERDDWVE
jgi:hypothetical protein